MYPQCIPWVSAPLPPVRVERIPTRNYRATDWKEFTNHLTALLTDSPEPCRLNSHEEFRNALNVINTSIKSAIETHVPMSKPLPHTKRWWTKELSNMRKTKNRIARTSHRWRGISDHSSHQQHRQICKEYAKLIETTKKEHWETWLLNASERDIWTANKYATDPPTDGGRTRMPTLNYSEPNGVTRRTTTNAEKSNALADSFFHPPPTSPTIPHTCYPKPADIFRFFTRAQIKKAAHKLEPFKAPGPDGIPNVVLKKSMEVIADRLPLYLQSHLRTESLPRQVERINNGSTTQTRETLIRGTESLPTNCVTQHPQQTILINHSRRPQPLLRDQRSTTEIPIRWQTVPINI